MNFSWSDLLLHVVPELENSPYYKTLSDTTEITREAKISSTEILCGKQIENINLTQSMNFGEHKNRTQNLREGKASLTIIRYRFNTQQ